MDIREFKNTYPTFAPSIIWDWCAKPTFEEIDAQLEKFSGYGITKVYIRPSNGLVLPYLSEDYFEMLRTAARRSAKYGISLWIFDENSASSGTGGGEITSVGDYRVRDFVKTDKANLEKTDRVIFEDGSSIYALRDMSSVTGKKRFPLSDTTDPFVTECFTDAVYDKYIRACKRFIGCEIKGFVTQINFPENSILHSLTAIEKLENEDIVSLCRKLTKNDTSAIKKYFESYNGCLLSNYTVPLLKKCHSNNLSLCVSVSGNTNISRQMHYIASDEISLPVNASSPDLLEIKLAETISAQFEKPFKIRLITDKFSPCSERFNKAASLCAMGGEICYDSVAFSLTDRRKYENGAVVLSEFSEKDISKRLSRFSKVVSQTDSMASTLIIYQNENIKYFSELCEHLISQGIDFHIVEENIFRNYSRVFSDKVSIGKFDYQTVVYVKDTDVVPQVFTGKRIALDTLLSAKNCTISTDFEEEFSSDKGILVNRRTDGENSYIFITAHDDTKLSVSSSKNLFVADSSNGELYELSFGQEFTIRKGKTVLFVQSDTLMADKTPPYTDEVQFIPYDNKLEIPFLLTSAGENILPLKTVNACFGRKSYREADIDSLHREFYLLNNNETVKVKYPFYADKDKIGDVKLYIENADNLEFIELNGKALTNFSPSINDPRFMGKSITSLLSDGKNTISLEYKKSNNYTPDFLSYTPQHFYSFNVTTFEPVYLCGDFDVKGEKLTRLESYENDITLSGMPSYYGSITYTTKLPDTNLSETILSVNGSFDICSIKIGKREAIYYSEVPVMELFNLDCGMLAEITVFNTPYNLFSLSGEKCVPFGIEKIEICSQ